MGLKPLAKIGVKKIFETLTINPYGYPYKKIKGEQNLYRIRVGGYRILYEIHHGILQIWIVRIDKRGRVYK